MGLGGGGHSRGSTRGKALEGRRCLLRLRAGLAADTQACGMGQLQHSWLASKGSTPWPRSLPTSGARLLPLVTTYGAWAAPLMRPQSHSRTLRTSSATTLRLRSAAASSSGVTAGRPLGVAGRAAARSASSSASSWRSCCFTAGPASAALAAASAAAAAARSAAACRTAAAAASRTASAASAAARRRASFSALACCHCCRRASMSSWVSVSRPFMYSSDSRMSSTACCSAASSAPAASAAASEASAAALLAIAPLQLSSASSRLCKPTRCSFEKRVTQG